MIHLFFEQKRFQNILKQSTAQKDFHLTRELVSRQLIPNGLLSIKQIPDDKKIIRFKEYIQEKKPIDKE